MVVIFVAVAIMLGIGVAILGSTDIVDCDDLTGDSNSTGWRGQCHDIQKQSQDSFGLLVVVLIVVAAVAVLSVVRMLGN